MALRGLTWSPSWSWSWSWGVGGPWAVPVAVDDELTAVEGADELARGEGGYEAVWWWWWWCWRCARP